jgi:hypothetical protein
MTPDAPTTATAGHGNGRRLEEGRPPNPQSGGVSTISLPRGRGRGLGPMGEGA